MRVPETTSLGENMLYNYQVLNVRMGPLWLSLANQSLVVVTSQWLLR